VRAASYGEDPGYRWQPPTPWSESMEREDEERSRYLSRRLGLKDSKIRLVAPVKAPPRHPHCRECGKDMAPGTTSRVCGDACRSKELRALARKYGMNKKSNRPLPVEALTDHGIRIRIGALRKLVMERPRDKGLKVRLGMLNSELIRRAG
jgi:predicted nucleic acid-binding Zn ribbon protein